MKNRELLQVSTPSSIKKFSPMPLFILHLLSICFCFSVERDRLRERERQARAQMSSQVADQESPGPSGNFLFREPIRVSNAFQLCF